MRYRIKSAQLSDGSQLDFGRLTVLLGPNNSGKSRALSDLAHHIYRAVRPPLVLPQVSLEHPSSLSYVEAIPDVETSTDPQSGNYSVRALSAALTGRYANSFARGHEPTFRSIFRDAELGSN